MDKLIQIFREFSWPRDILDILLITVVMYYVFKLLKDSSASKIIYAFLVCLTIGVIGCTFGLRVVSHVFSDALLLILGFVVIIYATEIKRMIWRHNNPTVFDMMRGEETYNEDDLRTCTDHIIRAVLALAKKDVGALIVMVRNKEEIPAAILETGTLVNGYVSDQLLENIFVPKSPLHDGAVVIKGNRILAAGCFLPLTQDNTLPKDLGTRHRAGIGVTEANDYVSLVVSEETGIITICERGKYRRYADAAALKAALEDVYGLTVRQKHTIRWTKK